MENNNKKALLLSIVAVIALVALVVSATYAYFVAQGGTTSNAGVDVLTHTTDSLLFKTGDAISFTANQTNFAEGGINLFGESFAKASLIANNKTNNATYNYYVYLDITNNEFKYTTKEKTGELILSVTDPTGVELKTIPGLNYVTVKGVSGFDITEAKDLVTIVDNHAITANPKKDETWNIKITLVNLDSDQTTNAGKSFDAKLIIQKESKSITLANYIKGLYTNQGANGLYLHDSTLENGANDNSYRYAGANPNNYVCFGSDVNPCPIDNQYRIIGVFGEKVKLIKSDYATIEQLGTSGDYYNNYQDSGNTTSHYKGNLNLSNVGAYYWNYSNGNSSLNNWNESRLNNINLNINFLNKLGTTWANKIIATMWKVGGNTWNNIGEKPMNIAYKNEIITPIATTTHNAKVGLMYVSDYGYAASSKYWTYPGYNPNETGNDYKDAVNENWMHMGLYEWTISRQADNTSYAYLLLSLGNISYSGVGGLIAVRPTFFLMPSVNYVSGSGSLIDPIIIN